ncbi:hypothetical protein A2U01_0081957 [Trifolium medium]|uniref:Uncharacterized protein n=1 Tax=Trifolium medium TaxID=97028 RepID=A0A392THT7_9FABA|nr:hypothetical protein [Trifolium medium]
MGVAETVVGVGGGDVGEVSYFTSQSFFIGSVFRSMFLWMQAKILLGTNMFL